jgi:hypothetical protein
MLEDDDSRTRPKLLAGSNSISKKEKTTNDELITNTFPSLKARERTLLHCIIQTIWDIGFSVAHYDEVIIRLKRREKKLFPSKRIIDETIRNMCKSGIIISEMSEFSVSNAEGTPGPWKRERVLKLPEAFRIEALNRIT